MKEEYRVLAFDFGASSGRAMLAIYKDGKIFMEEVHRFSNDSVVVNQTMYWDTLRLFYEIKQGMIKAKLKGGFDSIGIDTWGVDFGLLDKDGYLLENQIHYRDSRTEGMIEDCEEYISKDKFYQITGLQFMEINTIYQLLSLAKKRPEMLERADTLLMTPDLFNYFLSGRKCTEYSIASTTQLLDARTHQWSDEIIDSLPIPRKILKEIVPTGTVIGQLRDEICEELGVPKANVVAVAGHDTQCALAAAPAEEEDFVFLSCGTWSLLGTELKEPIINEKSKKYNITNEGGYGFKTSFLKNIIGLWLIQESRRQWKREGKEYSFSELEALASEAEPLQSLIDPDAKEFVPQGNIPKRIQKYCERTGQKVPQTIGEIVRCINESLALKYRYSLEQIEECTGISYSTLYMLGGGMQSKLLCQMTANACQKKVSAGPVEATVLGNIALQLIAAGQIKDIKEARECIKRSEEVHIYVPSEKEAEKKQWEAAYQKMLELIAD